jgi:hypothetical protein
MSELREYRRRHHTRVIAIRLDLDFDEFSYRKWGGMQTARPGDWLVHRGDETYTIGGDVFERTYRKVDPGLYEKETPVWARIAEADGVIRTKEGDTRYAAGDVLVFNDPEGADGWAMARKTFDDLYEAV